MPIALSVKVQEQSEPPRELGEGRGQHREATGCGANHQPLEPRHRIALRTNEVLNGDMTVLVSYGCCHKFPQI